MAYLFQSLVIFAVAASNIRWQWTPNGYLAAGLGIALAYVLTWLALTISGWFRRVVQLKAPSLDGSVNRR
jgi:ABC-type transport system involved in cytochrome c biogenesis permease subunit